MEGSMGIETSRLRRLGAPVVGLAVLTAAGAVGIGVGAAGAAGPSAKAARSLNLNDSASLRLANHKGVELKEVGFAHGNLPGEIYIQLRLASQHSVSAKIQVYPSGGSINATAEAHYTIHTSSSASFSGTLTITGGSGRYTRAKGSKLSFSGTVHRPSDSVSVHVSGKMSY
jgi:hypothetical protein